MAEVGTITYKEITGEIGKRVFTCTLTGATSTIGGGTHKFGTLRNVQLRVRGTNTMTFTVSGTTITVTGTNGDTVDAVIYGV